MKTDRVRKSAYILPNLFTSMNLLCGYYAVFASFRGYFIYAAIAVMAGAVFDLLDGKIVRATNTTSQLGTEYDSLADLVSFGLAPAVLIVLWGLEPMGGPGWFVGFLFTTCGALRLARFNTSPVSGLYFEGVPIPAAAALSVSVVLLCDRLGIDPGALRGYLPVMICVVSFCMVSSFRYKGMKNVPLFRRLTFGNLACLVPVLAAFVMEPFIVLSGAFFLYAVSGPLLFLVER